jgi:hypothetical protein
MEPVSLVASIVTIVVTAFQTASALSDAVNTVRDAPQEISSCATEISCLAITLQSLGDVMNSNPTLYKQDLVRVVSTCVGQFELQQRKVKDIVKGCERRRGRLRWALKKGRVKTILLELQGLKSTLNMTLHTLTLAREQQKEKE